MKNIPLPMMMMMIMMTMKSCPHNPPHPFCIITTVTSNTNGLFLAVYVDTDEEAYSFSNNPAEFSIYNCATYQICSILGMLISMRAADKTGMQGVNGSTTASGIGTIKFTITDDNNIKHTIMLHDVIYLLRI